MMLFGDDGLVCLCERFDSFLTLGHCLFVSFFFCLVDRVSVDSINQLFSTSGIQMDVSCVCLGCVTGLIGPRFALPSHAIPSFLLVAQFNVSILMCWERRCLVLLWVDGGRFIVGALPYLALSFLF